MKKENDGHLACLFSMLEKAPDDSFLRYAVAQEFLKRNDSAKALEYFKNLLENDPAYTATYYHLGKLYEQLGQKENAVKTYETGMQVTKKNGDAHAFSELQSALSLIAE